MITANKSATAQHHGTFRIDHNFSNTHSLFARYIIDDSSSLVPDRRDATGNLRPRIPSPSPSTPKSVTLLVQDRRSLGHDVFNELRFNINRTTASTSNRRYASGALLFLLVPGRPFGTIDIAGMSLLGDSAVIPLGTFSTVYQLQDQLSRTIGHHTWKYGAQFP